MNDEEKREKRRKLLSSYILMRCALIRAKRQNGEKWGQIAKDLCIDKQTLRKFRKAYNALNPDDALE